MNEIISSIIDDKKKMSIDILFLFLFGAILVLFGASSGTIGILGKVFSLPIKDEFRWMIILMGFSFILTAVFLTTKVRSGSTSGVEDKTLMPPFYTFHGLDDEPRTDTMLQNFEIDRVGGSNRNAVYYMWTDTFKKNMIQPSIEHNDNDGSFLHIYFKHQITTEWFSNIAIRPMSEQALDNHSDQTGCKYKYRFLKIKARVSKESSASVLSVGITLRVCDKNLIYWEFSNRNREFLQIQISDSKWQWKYVDLEDDRLWSQFKSDGNHKNNEIVPNFSIISGVVLVFGGYNSNGQTLAPGDGSVDLREISLSKTSQI